MMELTEKIKDNIKTATGVVSISPSLFGTISTLTKEYPDYSEYFLNKIEKYTEQLKTEKINKKEFDFLVSSATSLSSLGEKIKEEHERKKAAKARHLLLSLLQVGVVFL